MLLAAAPTLAAGLLNGVYLPAIANDPVAYWTAELAQWIVLPALCLTVLARVAGVLPAEYGLRMPPPGQRLRVLLVDSAAVGLLLWAVYAGMSALAWRALPVSPPEFSYHALVPDGALRGLVVVYFAVTAGFVEEVTFRGLPRAALGHRLAAAGPRAAYVAGSAVLFALIHWENGAPELVATFFYGVVAALLYLRFDNLWPLVIGHTAVDLVDFW